MIGNDIIDLHITRKNSNWRRPGFLGKLFSEEEQDHILSAPDQDPLVWQMWSMKEAAYKAQQRLYHLSPRFNPLSFRCFLKREGEDQVITESGKYSSKTWKTKDLIYTEVIAPGEMPCMFSAIKFFSSQKTLKQELLQVLKKHLKDNQGSELQIKKCINRIPWILSEKKQLDIPFSITHHGAYCAYVIRKVW